MDTHLDRRRARIDAALDRHLPANYRPAWIEEVIDEPRFGWDREALEAGFFRPLREWIERHPGRLRPLLADALIDSMSERSDAHDVVLAALEIHYIAAVMLDDLKNGSDVRSSSVDWITMPLPVFVTVAYSARQLASVLIARRGRGLDSMHRSKLSMAFSRLLFRQGVGGALDIWSSGQRSVHKCTQDLVDHLRVYVGTLGFGLACESAAIVSGCDGEATSTLRAAGIDFGVGLRLAALARGEHRSLQFGGRDCMEPLIRWRTTAKPAALEASAKCLVDRACELAGSAHPGAADAFRDMHRLTG